LNMLMKARLNMGGARAKSSNPGVKRFYNVEFQMHTLAGLSTGVNRNLTYVRVFLPQQRVGT
jgi:hypothetical protein